MGFGSFPGQMFMCRFMLHLRL